MPLERPVFFFFFQAEDGIRDLYETGVQTCALPISTPRLRGCSSAGRAPVLQAGGRGFDPHQLHHAWRRVMPVAVPLGTAAGIAVSIRGGKRSAPAKWSLTIWTGNRQ